MIELMVAMVMGLFIVGGAIAILINNQSNYRHNEDLGRIQENARLALDIIGSDLRAAGFTGCTNADKLTNHLSFSAGGLLDMSDLLEGYDPDSGSWQPSGNSDLNGEIVTGSDGVSTDAITIRKLRHGGTPITANMASADGDLSVDVSASGLSGGQLAAIYDCEGTDIFRVASVDPDSNVITHGATFSKAYEQNAGFLDDTSLGDAAAKTFVAPVDVVRYFIGDSDETGRPGLRKQFYDGTGVVDFELIEGAENMQIFYGLDSGLDGSADSFVDAANVTNWKRVVAIKLNLLLSAATEYGIEEDDQSYDIHDTPDNEDDDITVGDRRTRKLVSSTVLLRNMQLKIE